MRRLALVLLIWCGLGGISGCDSANPVAPPGTIITLTATPARISSNGVSEIRVRANKPNGTPVNEGTVILLGTTVGRIDPSVQVDADGEAVTLLHGDGQFGMATVSASTGGAEAVTVEVQVGLSATSISLQASPSTVPETGGTIDLLALVRDDQGQPLENALVNFLTDIGVLDSGGSVIATDSGGSASDRLTVEAAETDVLQGDTFQVQVEVGSGSGSLVSTSKTIIVQRRIQADFTFGTSNLTVVFTDTSDGSPTRWLWNFGDGPNPPQGSNTSERQNPSFTYDQPGTYTVTFTASNSLGADTISKFVSVSGQ